LTGANVHLRDHAGDTYVVSATHSIWTIAALLRSEGIIDDQPPPGAVQTANHRSGPRRVAPRRVWRLAGVLVLAACGVLGPAAPAAADGYPPVDLAAVDLVMSDELAAASIPGAAIAITRGDQVLHVRGYGHDADDVPITEDTRFRIASLSKSFTSLAVLQLVDAGCP
jgi:hypothetical protein